MEKTDSVVNLTKLSLYGIYNTSSVSLNQENEEVEEYYDGKKLHIKAKEAHPPLKQTPRPPTHAKESAAAKAASILWRVLAVSAAAFAYNEVTKNIHYTHGNSAADINAFLLQFAGTWKPFRELVKRHNLGAVDQFLLLVLEGLLLSFIVPVLDNLLPKGCSKRLLSSNPDPYHRANLTNDIIRSLIAFLGISYGIRHIEWESSLQMATAWSLINPCLWLLLDGTISGFVASAVVALVGSAVIYGQSGVNFTGDVRSLVTIFMFIASFFFCGVIIFGKLGRFLFGKNS